MEFDNSTKIEGDHQQDCCESNYIDFKGSLKDILEVGQEFKTIEIKKDEDTNKYGFDLYLDNVRYPINCYSDQNGYYSSDIEVKLMTSEQIITEFTFDAEQRY